MFKGLVILLTALAIGGSWHKGVYGNKHRPHHNIEYVYYELASGEDSEEAAIGEEHDAYFRMGNEEVAKYLDEDRYKHKEYKFFEFDSDEEMAFSDEDYSASDEEHYKNVRMASGEDMHGYYGYLHDDHYGGRHH